ncbi:MAG: XrtA/PEP-CTERM system-associated ATPase [Candidatus Scalindua sp.]
MYRKFYNLSSKPFRLNPDPRFFYSSKTHKRALAYLRYGIEQGEGFIIITGDVGTGKTTLVSRLLRSLKSQNIISAHIVNSQLQPSDLLRMASAEFELSYSNANKATLLKNLKSFFLSCMEQNKRVLLIVDEAQNLTSKSLEELRMLSNMQQNGRQLLQSFLLGQKEFRNMIRSSGYEQLRQRVIATYHLRPLDKEETREYIIYRLNVAGWKNDPEVDNDVFDNIFHYTKGLPRKINLLCDRILLYGCLEELHHICYQDYQSVLIDIEDEFWCEEIVNDELIDNDSNIRLTGNNTSAD